MRQQTPRAEGQWAPGSQVGRYALLAKLATGGMAEIWLADQAGPQGFQKLVVIKRILESYGANEDFVTMFLDEARIAAQLNHPNVVQIFDLGELAGAYYIAMEYLPGENLSAVVRTSIKRQRPLPLPLGVKIVSSAAAGLGHAHTKLAANGQPLNVVHRDVSPQNLIITLEGNVKVVDFGVARAANRATQTTDGQIKGKVAYMSPEQAKGEPLDARSDVFSLGIILFEIATGTRFFGEREMSAILGVLCGSGPLPRARERNPEVPADLDELIATALWREPGRRFANGSALHEALEDWLHRQPTKASTLQIAEHLGQVFSAEWSKRSELIDAARAGQLTPSGLRKNLSRDDGDATMPGGTSKEQPQIDLTPPSRPWLVGGGVLALLVAGLVVGLVVARRVVATPTTLVELPLTPPPEARPTMLRIETDPEGAQVSVDGAPRGASPVEIPGLALGEHEIAASLPGRQSASRKLTLREAGERSQLSLTLPPVAALQAVALAPKSPEPDPEPRVVAPQATVGKGRLTLQTQPWTEVFLGSKRLGETPLLDYPLAAGRHTLRLENAEAGLKTSVEVEILAGKTTVKKLTF